MLGSAAELIRKRPAMFLESGRPTHMQFVAAVLEDLEDAGVKKYEVFREGEYTMISAAQDWLYSDEYELAEFFTCFVTIGPKRPNSFRAEILLATCCQGVIALGQGAHFSRGLEKADLPFSFQKQAARWSRSIAWRLDETLHFPSTQGD
jgi:hypothetical protein